MKKYIVFVLSLIFIISAYSGLTEKINYDKSDDLLPINQNERPSMQIIPISNKKPDLSDIYFTPIVQKGNNEGYNYIIITADSLENSILTSTFIAWKESLNFKIKIIKISDPLIQDQKGEDLQAKIRNFLREYYQSWGIIYVLIVGDHDTIPMRYCYPNPGNHQFNIYDSGSGEVPTDYYYADLSFSDSESWDSDGDGFYGEFTEDEPDFMAEVYVGRIPTSNTLEIIYTLDKIVNFEKDTGDWKKSALHAGSMLFYKNEDHRYEIDHDIDGATCLNAIEENIMDDWTITHFSEQEGLSPSIYDWYSLSEPDFTNEWRNGKYAIVNWAGHGSSVGVGRTIWESDDGDGVPEHSENEIIGKPQINIYSKLDDDYPSIVFAVSCLVGYPEITGYGNLGIELLTKSSSGAAVGICSASRPAAVSADFTSTHSGAEALCYEFNNFMIKGPDGPEPIGAALYKAKYYVHHNFGWDEWYYEYQNLYNYNLYGDPSMRREGVSDIQMNIEISHPGNGIYVNNNKILPFFTPIIVGDVIINTSTSENIQYVEFYLDDDLKETDMEKPFEWVYDEIGFFKHDIKVVAYDTLENYIEADLVIWKFF